MVVCRARARRRRKSTLWIWGWSCFKLAWMDSEQRWRFNRQTTTLSTQSCPSCMESRKKKSFGVHSFLFVYARIVSTPQISFGESSFAGSLVIGIKAQQSGSVLFLGFGIHPRDHDFNELINIHLSGVLFARIIRCMRAVILFCGYVKNAHVLAQPALFWWNNRRHDRVRAWLCYAFLYIL